MATSDLLSNAAQTTSVNGNSIIPVASDAGQPTKNVKLSTLASVVGGLLGIDDSWFRERTGSLNSIILNGYSYYDPKTADAPTEDSGLLLIFGTKTFVCQLAYTLNEQRLYMRRSIKTGANWSSWLKISIE